MAGLQQDAASVCCEKRMVIFMKEYGLWDRLCIMIEVELETGKCRRILAGEQKGCGFMLTYPVIDVEETGRQLKLECDRKQVTPREIQEFLGLAALQSIYSWFQGRALPSLDNFYALSCYLGTRMEELVVPENRSREVLVREATRGLERRMLAYFGFWLQAEAGIAA